MQLVNRKRALIVFNAAVVSAVRRTISRESALIHRQRAILVVEYACAAEGSQCRVPRYLQTGCID